LVNSAEELKENIMQIGSIVKIISTTTPFLVKTIGMYGMILAVEEEEDDYLVQLPQVVNHSSRWWYQPFQVRDIDIVKYPEDKTNITEFLCQELVRLSCNRFSVAPPKPLTESDAELIKRLEIAEQDFTDLMQHVFKTEPYLCDYRGINQIKSVIEQLKKRL
jgi:hypothetical protein